MDAASPGCKVRECFKCHRNTEYFCGLCSWDLCFQCAQNHTNDLKTKDHTIRIYRDQFSFICKQEICIRHHESVYKKYCESCQVPICDLCSEHKVCRPLTCPFTFSMHKTLSIREAYKTQHQIHKGTFHSIRSETLFSRPILMAGVKTDFRTCHRKVSNLQSDLLSKAEKLKHSFDYASIGDFNYILFKQVRQMNRHIARIQSYEHIYELFSAKSVQFLSFIKNTCLPVVNDSPNLTKKYQFSLKPIIKNDVMESLMQIRLSETGKRHIENERVLKMMYYPAFFEYIRVEDVQGCYHISYVTSDQVWVSDNEHNLILMRYGDNISVIHHLKDLSNGYGLHTVNRENELFFISRKLSIKKLTNKMKKVTFVEKKKGCSWKPQCVYWSTSTGDLLVGMYCTKYPMTGKVIRYNNTGQQTQTIQHDSTGRELYSKPNYIVDNNNGDIVVSNINSWSGAAVVVTDRGGKHRFSYTGCPSGSNLEPYGICTDALSHILVCDVTTKTVQMIDRDGQFLSHLLTESQQIDTPLSLSYDFNTHRLFVGSGYKKIVSVYTYITQEDAKTDPILDTADTKEAQRKIHFAGVKNQRSECMPILELQLSFRVSDHHSLYHISCTTFDQVWVSCTDNSLVLKNTVGKTLHYLEDDCGNLLGGSHSVNSESELIYIDSDYNIMKMSKDEKVSRLFIEKNYSQWKPLCLYCSLSTGNLLVAMSMYNRNIRTGKIIRYNKSGELIQTIQYDNTGLELFKLPHYITENNNWDIVVSDFDWLSGAVVVTERGGRHRFSYKGHPAGQGLQPWGVCTDALSNILVCDEITSTVQLINKNGQFLSHLLTKVQGIYKPTCLAYDVNTARLLVGSLKNNRVYVYRYIIQEMRLALGHIQDENKSLQLKFAI